MIRAMKSICATSMLFLGLSVFSVSSMAKDKEEGISESTQNFIFEEVSSSSKQLLTTQGRLSLDRILERTQFIDKAHMSPETQIQEFKSLATGSLLKIIQTYDVAIEREKVVLSDTGRLVMYHLLYCFEYFRHYKMMPGVFSPRPGTKGSYSSRKYWYDTAQAIGFMKNRDPNVYATKNSQVVATILDAMGANQVLEKSSGKASALWSWRSLIYGAQKHIGSDHPRGSGFPKDKDTKVERILNVHFWSLGVAVPAATAYMLVDNFGGLWGSIISVVLTYYWYEFVSFEKFDKETRVRHTRNVSAFEDIDSFTEKLIPSENESINCRSSMKSLNDAARK